MADRLLGVVVEQQRDRRLERDAERLDDVAAVPVIVRVTGSAALMCRTLYARWGIAQMSLRAPSEFRVE
jgi:hypothetical protein